MYTLSFASQLEAPAADVWRVVASMPGVNAELGPWLKMTVPARAAGMSIDHAPVGETLFASWVLLGGVLPLDRHSLRLTSVDPGHGFVEDSTSWVERHWRHRRDVVAHKGLRCLLTDTLDFEPRLAPSGALLVRVVRAVFEHRHRRLRARFGGELRRAS